MADKRHYGAFVTFKAAKRQGLWNRVQGKAGAPPSRGSPKRRREWLKPGLVGGTFLKGEEKLKLRPNETD